MRPERGSNNPGRALLGQRGARTQLQGPFLSLKDGGGVESKITLHFAKAWPSQTLSGGSGVSSSAGRGPTVLLSDSFF